MSLKSKHPNMAKFPKSFLYAGIILLISLLCAAAYMGGGKSENAFNKVAASSEQSAGPGPEKVVSDSNSSCPTQLLWQTDARQMYDYELETDILLDPSVLTGESGAKTKIRVGVKGILNFRIFDHPTKSSGTSEKIEGWEKSVYAGFQFSPAEVRIYGNSDTEGRRMAELEKLYETFFIVAFSKQGTPSMFYFPNPLDPKDKSSLSELVKIAQLFMPSKKLSKEWVEGKHQWVKKEKRASGKFEAEYFVHKDECDTIVKRNLRCLSVLSNDMSSPGSEKVNLTGHVIHSEFKGRIEPDVSWLASFSGSEQFEIRAGKNVWSVSEGTINLRLREFDPNPSLAIWKEDQGVKAIIQSFADPDKKADTKAIGAWEQERMKGMAEQFKNVSVSELLADIKDALEAGNNQSEMARLTHTLRDFLETYPEKALSVPDLIKNMALSDQGAGSVLLALQLAGHPQAQDALKTVFEDGEQLSDNRLRAIVASGGIKAPEKPLIESLFNLSENREDADDEDLERSDTGFLALGILSDALSKGENPSDAQGINERILNYLENSDDERERIICLKALDNSAAPSIIPEIEPYLVSESVAERSAAVGTLRNFSDDYSLELLAEALENDPETSVRDTAVEALAERGGISEVEHVRKQLSEETDENLRRKMIRFLGENRTPDVTETLKSQLEKESSRAAAKDIFRALYEVRAQQTGGENHAIQ
ncbi:MAG: hypothetical protein DRI57_22615 [Deltaproteobacteria bacterium]|nr:MAG: hypothetical protein DRI57_22615 [Deltaproteobacteria bacterium]